MKNITGRHNIAMAINMSGKPVVTIDLDNKKYLVPGKEDSWIIEGSKIRVARQYTNLRHEVETYYDHATLSTYGDNSNDGHAYALATFGCGIYADFVYEDVVDDAEWANTPIVHDGDHVIVVELHSKTREYAVKEGVVTLNGANITPAGYID